MRDVVAAARSSGLTHPQVARDFGIVENPVARWLKQANVDVGLVEGVTSAEQTELVAPRCRAGVPKQEVETRRRAMAYFAKDAARMTFSLVRDLTFGEFPVTVTCVLLHFPTQADYRWLADLICQRD